jgi:nucleotide-binding universal stress UspA family protein
MNNNASVLAGVDGSASSQDAVRWAAAEAALRHAPLLLVSTYPMPVDYMGYGAVPPSFFVEREAEGKRMLAEATKLATEAGRGLGPVNIETQLVTGPPIPYLLEQSHTARMIVLGSRGLGEFTGGLLGSVSTAVAAHASCPVAVIRGLPGPGDPGLDGPVVVGVDGSKNSEPAIAAAFEEASLRNADLTAVHAWTDFNVSTAFKVDNNDMELAWPAIEVGEQAVLSESMAGWKEQYPDVSVRQVVVKDRPVRNLVHQAETAQLVVVGSRGRGGFKGMLLGSTSRALLHTVERPLLVVRDNT